MGPVPYPTTPALPLLEVNFVCGDIEKYDGLGFIDYPVRRGWSPYAGSSQWMNCSSEVAAKRAQSWLYFGLLHEIFGPEYTQEKFLRPNPNGIGFLVETKKLPDLLFKLSRFKYHEWAGVFNFNKSKDLEFVNRCRPICVEVNLQSDLFDRYDAECQTLSLSIKVLLQSVQTAICNLEQNESQSIMVTNTVFPARLTYDRMIEAGWCQKQATDLSAYSVIGAHYLAALPRKHFGAGHEECKPNDYVANNVDENFYAVAHISEHYQCQLHGPEVPKIIQAVKEGDIPLISISLTPAGYPRLSVLNASPDVQYTAISHSSQESEEPQTQEENLFIPSLMARILGFCNPISDLYGLEWYYSFPDMFHRRKNPQSRDLELASIEEKSQVIFWMDTLCIPPGLENASLRANAINKMDLIYAGARDVLVLDPELQKISLEGVPQEETSAHILCSPWMTRCWTLQEARLSSNWYAQFADGIFDPRSAHIRLMNDVGSYTALKKKFDDLGCLKHEMFVEWYYRQLHKHNLSELGLTIKVNDPFHIEWDNLARRSTTKKEDIHCILANMLGFSAGELLELPYEERMKAILCTQTTLPLKLLFNQGPRIQDLDNRWVPSYPEGTVGNGLGYLKVTPNGLLFDHTTARCEGFLVSSPTPPPTTFCVSVLPNGSSEPLWASPPDKDTGLVFEASTRIVTCYILGEDIHSRSALRDPVGRAILGRHDGARFALQRREGNILHLLYEHPVKFRYSAKDYDAYHRLKEDGSGWTLVNAEKIDMNHVYHIDSDIGSWPKLTNRDIIIEEMKAHDIENIGIYLFTAGEVVWIPFSLLSGLSIANSGLLVTIAGPLLIILTRFALIRVEYRRLRAVLHSQQREMYIRTYYYHNNNSPDDIASPGLPEEHHQTGGGGGGGGDVGGGGCGSGKLKSSVFLQVDGWQLFLAVATATALIVVGVRFAPSQKWALWMGLAILTELVMRLVLEALWRKTDFGRLVPRWLARQTWWNSEHVVESL